MKAKHHARHARRAHQTSTATIAPNYGKDGNLHLMPSHITKARRRYLSGSDKGSATDDRIAGALQRASGFVQVAIELSVTCKLAFAFAGRIGADYHSSSTLLDTASSPTIFVLPVTAWRVVD